MSVMRVDVERQTSPSTVKVQERSRKLSSSMDDDNLAR